MSKSTTPLVRLFPIIKNRSVFINNDHPSLHPRSDEWVAYWKGEKKKCIEGLWANESEGTDNAPSWRYMPPTLYFMINQWQILLDSEVAAGRAIGKPFLRDVEWLIHTDWLACAGFSGFQFGEFSGNTLIKKHWQVHDGIVDDEGVLVKMTTLEERQLAKTDFVLDSNGRYKKYKDPLDILSESYMHSQGLPLYDNETESYFLLSSRSNGKMLRTDELVRVKDGWKEIGKLNVGDEVYGSDGNLAKVTFKTDVQKSLEMYKITLRDGRTIECCEDHLWKVWDKRRHRHRKEDPYSIKSTKDLLEGLYYMRRDSSFFSKTGIERKVKEFQYALPIMDPMKHESYSALDIDPYVLGCILGDGSTASGSTSFTSVDIDILDKINSLLPTGYRLKSIAGDNYGYYFSRGDRRDIPAFKNYMENLGLQGTKSDTKFIPEKYKLGTYEQRLELLRGLCDTDGHASKTYVEYVTVSDRLSDDVLDLCRSLGMGCSKRLKTNCGYKDKDGNFIKCKDAWRLYIYTDERAFSLQRKKDNIKSATTPYHKSKQEKSFIVDIEYIGKGDGVCIGVDNEDHTYITKDYIVTHNSISAGSIIGHEITFDGRRYFMSDLDVGYTKSASEVFLGAPETQKMKNLLGYVMDGIDNLYGEYDKDGLFEPPPFSRNWTGLSKSKDKGNAYHEYEKIQGGKRKKVRSGTNIAYGTFTMANPNAAVSNRRTLIAIDEIGLLENVEEVLGANANVISIFGKYFGRQLLLGTGGDISKIDGCKRIFYNPTENRFISFEDKWENRGRIGRFIPAEYSLQDYKDEQGNTLLEDAREALDIERLKLSKADSHLPLLQKKMYMPQKPSEMFVARNFNLFPIDKINKRLSEAEENYEINTKLGWLEWVGVGREQVKWDPIPFHSSRKPLNRLNLTGFTNFGGAIEMFEHPPEYLPEPRNSRALYKVVYDPVMDDEGGTSLASIQVWKGFAHDTWEQGGRDFICCKWLGRFDDTTEIHELVIKICKYFNAKVLVEMNVSEFYKWAKKNSLLHFLQPSLHNFTNKYSYGITMRGNGTSSMKKEGELALRNLLIEEREPDEDGNARTNVDFFNSPRTLEELASYSRDGNFDDVSSLLILSLWLASEHKHTVEKKDTKKDDRGKVLVGLLQRV